MIVMISQDYTTLDIKRIGETENVDSITGQNETY